MTTARRASKGFLVAGIRAAGRGVVLGPGLVDRFAACAALSGEGIWPGPGLVLTVPAGRRGLVPGRRGFAVGGRGGLEGLGRARGPAGGPSRSNCWAR